MNGNFFARYYAMVFGEIIRGTKPQHIIIPMIAWIIMINGFSRFSPIRILIGACVGVLFTFMWYLIGTLIVVYKNASLYKILDEKGFCIEYLRAYEQKRIIGKPFNIQYALEYAEIFMRIGQPAEAIKYLNTLTIPPNANVLFQAEYFYLYVMSALKIGNLAIAEDLWSRSSDMIAKISANPKLCKSGGHLAILAMISIDCYAASLNGDKTRLERAFQQTENFLNSYKIADSTMFRVMLLYELRELGFTERYNQLLPEVRSEINASKPLFNCIRNMQHENLDRIEKGGLPFLPLDK